MVITWNARSIRWFQAASQYTGFHENLLRCLLPALPVGGTLCDLGCGAAMMDFLLADHLGAVTCVDWDRQVLRSVEERIVRDGRTNMDTRCENVHHLAGRWDTVLLLFYGRVGEHIEDNLRLCRKNVIAVVRGGSLANLGWGEYRSPQSRTIDHTATVLADKGIPFQVVQCTMEYGQPLESWEDATAYIHTYRKCPPGACVQEYLKRSLVSTSDRKYPLYLPYQKRYGILNKSKQEAAGRLRATRRSVYMASSGIR